MQQIAAPLLDCAILRLVRCRALLAHHDRDGLRPRFDLAAAARPQRAFLVLVHDFGPRHVSVPTTRATPSPLSASRTRRWTARAHSAPCTTDSRSTGRGGDSRRSE